MEYIQAIKKCKEGNSIRCVLMDKGEHIEYCKQKKRLLWWDAHHSGHLSCPQDMSDEDYQKFILADWVICNNIKPVKRRQTKCKN